MKLSRFLLKCLAIITGLIGAVWALGGPVIFLYIVIGVVRDRESFGDTSVVAAYIAISIIMSILGVLIIRHAWFHLRRPDRATARVVIGIATFLLGAVAYHFLKKELDLFVADERNDPTFELLFSLGLTLALFLSYRLAGRRLAARAYPSPATESHA